MSITNITIYTGDSFDNFTEWDMSSDKFPENSGRGQRYYGVKGPTNELLDRRGNQIPDAVWLTSLKDNASPTNPFDWAIGYTIN